MLRITEERVRKGWSRTELARRSGMHPADIGKIERRILRPYPLQLARVARALRWPVRRAGRLLEEVPSTCDSRGAGSGDAA